MSFIERFQTSLESLPQPATKKNYVIAYSGGLDSQVLLFCFKKINIPMRAVHVHHGLQSQADEWVTHCQHSCGQLNIPLDVLYVNAQKKSAESPEESARNARYHALRENLNSGECLVTAQHMNDQAETLLLQLFRTASSAGLAAMPASKKFGKGLHLRPLLHFTREQIEQFSADENLQWIEDPSNQDTTYDRNFLRKIVFPLLNTRWHKISQQLTTVASLQSDNLKVLEDMAAIDLANCLITQASPLTFAVFKIQSILCLQAIHKLSTPRQLNLLRYWVITTLKMQPTRNLLQEIQCSLLNSQKDANPEIVFSDFSFRKFQGNLYLLKLNKPLKILNEIEWQPSSALQLPELNIQLNAVRVSAQGLNKKLLSEKFIIRFRQGGEDFHALGRRHSRSLKKLLQEANIPPWERDVLPLVYFDNELIAVAGLWLSQNFAADEGEQGWLVEVAAIK